MAFGHFLGDATFFGDVRLLPAGSILEDDATDDCLSVTEYAAGHPDDVAAAPLPEMLDLATRRFVEAVQRSTGAPASGPYGLSLSGGLDARTILAAVPSARAADDGQPGHAGQHGSRFGGRAVGARESPPSSADARPRVPRPSRRTCGRWCA